MSDVEVRGARMEDEAAILEIARREMAAQEALDPRFEIRADATGRYSVYLRDRIRDLDSMVFVAVVGGAVVGLAIGTVRTQESLFALRRFGYVSDLMVKAEARRLGVGRALYDRLVLWFQGLGLRVARMHVAERSDEARAFWKSVGAEPWLTESWVELPPVDGPPDPDGAGKSAAGSGADGADSGGAASPVGADE